MRSTIMPEGVAGKLLIAAHEYDKDKDNWRNLRKSGIGASEISAILGLHPWKTGLGVWLDKNSPTDPRDQEYPEAAEWGLIHEAAISRRFNVRYPQLGKVWPTPGLLQHEDHPVIRATLDRLLVKRRVNPPVSNGAALEIKTVGDKRYYDKLWAGGVPPIHTQLQAQQQMAVAGLERVYTPVLVSGNMMPEPYCVERDDTVIANMIAFAEDWWDTHMVKGERPEPVFADMDLLSELWPGKKSLPALRATDELLRLREKHLDAKRREKEAKADKSKAAYEIAKIMEDHEVAVDDDDFEILTLRLPAPSYDVRNAELREKYPAVWEELKYEKANTRRLLTKEINDDDDE